MGKSRSRSRSRSHNSNNASNDNEEIRKKIRFLLRSSYGYTDDNNPFGDPDLSKPFIWHKKIEKLSNLGFIQKIDSNYILSRLKQSKLEIDRIRKRKLQREELKEAIELDRNRAIKEKEQQNYDEWKQKDDKFHLAQEKLRTEIRIKQGREKPVDFINKVLMIWKGFFNIPNDFFDIPEYEKPYLLYELLDIESLKELYNELKIQLAIDIERLANKKFVCFYIDIASNFKQFHDLNEEELNEFIEYWNSMIDILESYIYPEKNIKNLAQELRGDIENILNNKSFTELDELEEEIKKNMDEQVLSSDIQFWSNVLYNLRIYRCKMKLKVMFDNFQKKNCENLDKIKKQSEQLAKTTLGFIPHHETTSKINYEDEGNLSPVMYESDEELRKISICEHDYLIRISETRKLLLVEQIGKWQSLNNPNNNTSKNNFTKLPISLKKQFREDKQLEDQNSKIEVEQNNFSRENDPQQKEFLEENYEITELKEEEKPLNSDEEVDKFLKKKSKDTSNFFVPSTVGTYKNHMDLLLGTTCYAVNTLKASRFYLKDDIMYDSNLNNEMKLIESQELGEGEAIFNDVVPLSNCNYIWNSKYKPRKPRYFNRVKTGYEWNKYNQVHYDYDNPPPKVIQGYKFNIFYPDLIDKSKAPQYFFERADTQDTCIIRFHAGPPYEDIAFKIVNREWDMTEKSGFKNVFDRGILYLYFNFKRYRYKR